MKENGLLTIDDLENLETACFMHKYENSSLPPAFLNFFFWSKPHKFTKKYV